MNSPNTPKLPPVPFYRIVRIVTRRNTDGSGEARAAIEDNYHHFLVTIRHDGTQVTETLSASPRSPWTLCGAAGDQLKALVGMPLHANVTAVLRHTDARLQCTHQFDLATLAVAATARGIAERTYEIVVLDPSVDRTQAVLRRDGSEILRWELDGATILRPEPFTDRPTAAGFTEWVAGNLDGDAAEAALVLRRAVFVARGGIKMELWDGQNHAPAFRGCWVQQPERNQSSFKIADSRKTFAVGIDRPTASDDAWLTFAE